MSETDKQGFHAIGPDNDMSDEEGNVKLQKSERSWELVGNDLKDIKPFLRALGAEFIGTFYLILVCVGAANPRVLGVMGESTSPAYFLSISCAFGFGIGAIVHILSESSGGHVNPAVSLALFLDRRISFLRCVCYTIVQFLGGFAGAGSLYALGQIGKVDSYAGGNFIAEDIEAQHAFFIEVLGTMFLVLTILSTIDEKRGYAPSYTGALSIGIAILVMHIWMIPYTNCSINPVRGTVWNAVNGDYPVENLIFMFGPWVGGALAVPVYNLIF